MLVWLVMFVVSGVLFVFLFFFFVFFFFFFFLYVLFIVVERLLFTLYVNFGFY